MNRLLYFVVLFLSIFLGLGTEKASANTFAGGIPETVPFVHNGVTYDRYIVISRTDYNICSNTMAFSLVSAEMEAAGYPYDSNAFSLTLSYGDIPAFRATAPNAHMAVFSTVNVNGVCSWTSASFEGVTSPNALYSLRADEAEAIHDHNFDLYTYSSEWGDLPFTFTGAYSDWGTWRGSGLLYEGEGFLSFPLSGVTPYTASVSSVMDQDTLGTASAYSSNGSVTAFNGEVGNGTIYPGTTCRPNGSYSNFLVGIIDYDGYTGGPTYLCYEGHPGYDYPKAEYTNILATSGGYLCAAVAATSAPTPPATGLWRNATHCPFNSAPNQPSVDWDDYHVIYIMHGPLYIEGSTNEYMTVYLHTKDLDASVESAIETSGYADVNKLQTIGRVGDVSPTDVGFHVHLEIYKKVGNTWERVDPYGDGVDEILWEH